MTKAFGNKPVGDKSQYPGIKATTSEPNKKEPVPGSKAEVWAPTGKPKAPKK